MKTSSNSVCPVWLGYTFLIPIRKFQHDPQKILSPYVKEGMSVMDYGCAMGWFSIPLAKMTGSHGKVYCVDIQAKMLENLNKRAVKFNVDNVIQTIQVGKDYNPDELIDRLDFILLFAVVHEVPDKQQLFNDLHKMLKKGGMILFAEPKGHVSPKDFEESINMALKEGLKPLPERPVERGLSKLLIKE
ncbi:MAG: class I SAM-dependent methyltransferase [Bacteroidales bacterium]|nr:class I SAM-dependent methyltransferase [Bacteroidales bacterium]